LIACVAACDANFPVGRILIRPFTSPDGLEIHPTEEDGLKIHPTEEDGLKIHPTEENQEFSRQGCAARDRRQAIGRPGLETDLPKTDFL
jgi:hypothetical protein